MAQLISVGTLLASMSSKELQPDPCTGQGVGKSQAGCIRTPARQGTALLPQETGVMGRQPRLRTHLQVGEVHLGWEDKPSP